MGSWKETFVVQSDSMILCFWSAKQILDMTGSYVKFFLMIRVCNAVHFPLDYLSYVNITVADLRPFLHACKLTS